MSGARRILVATRNPGKLREVTAILDGLGIEFLTLESFPGLLEPEETGSTFAENAALKARSYSLATGLWTLADDSGLEVDALEGAPGVRSARFAGDDRDDLANNARLVELLAGVPFDRRTARFRCAMALADGERILVESAGAIEGVIIDQPRGANGFGYDPHFLLPERGVTTAELPPAEKNRISHRGQALRELARRLRSLPL